MKRVLVVGGSLAGHQAAKCLRGLGYAGDLTVLGAELHRPYDRYPAVEGLSHRRAGPERLGDRAWRSRCRLATRADRHKPRPGWPIRHPRRWRSGLLRRSGGGHRLPTHGSPCRSVPRSRASSSCGPSRTARRSGPLSRVEGSGGDRRRWTDRRRGRLHGDGGRASDHAGRQLPDCLRRERSGSRRGASARLAPRERRAPVDKHSGKRPRGARRPGQRGRPAHRAAVGRRRRRPGDRDAAQHRVAPRQRPGCRP